MHTDRYVCICIFYCVVNMKEDHRTAYCHVYTRSHSAVVCM